MKTLIDPCHGALRRLFVSCLLVAVGCEGKSGILTEYQQSDSDASSTEGSATGATSEGGATGATSEGGATGTTTAGGACEDPSQPVTGPEVTVTVRNAGDADIFVLGGGFCQDPPYAVKDALGEAVITWLNAQCPPSCQLVIEADECGCPDIGCAPGVIRVTPGGSYPASWSGGRYEIVDLEECGPELCSGSCAATLPAEPGAYTFEAYANSAFTCTLDDCSCVPNAEGWCMVPEAVLEPALTAEAVLNYPGDGAVELVFD